MQKGSEKIKYYRNYTQMVKKDEVSISHQFSPYGLARLNFALRTPSGIQQGEPEASICCVIKGSQ